MSTGPRVPATDDQPAGVDTGIRFLTSDAAAGHTDLRANRLILVAVP